MIDFTNLVSVFILGLVGFVTGTGGTAAFTWFLNRSTRADENARKVAADEIARKKAAADEEEKRRDKAFLLAEAQQIAQTTALDSANRTIKRVERQCDNCLQKLASVEERTEALVDAVELLIENPSGVAERQAVRLRIREYRQVF